MKRSQKIFFMILSLGLFIAVLYYVFFVPKEFEDAEGIMQVEIQDSSYQEYREYVSDTNKGIKNLLDGEQLKQITINDYPDVDLNIPRNSNPFAKSF